MSQWTVLTPEADSASQSLGEDDDEIDELESQSHTASVPLAHSSPSRPAAKRKDADDHVGGPLRKRARFSLDAAAAGGVATRERPSPAPAPPPRRLAPTSQPSSAPIASGSRPAVSSSQPAPVRLPAAALSSAGGVKRRAQRPSEPSGSRPAASQPPLTTAASSPSRPPASVPTRPTIASPTRPPQPAASTRATSGSSGSGSATVRPAPTASASQPQPQRRRSTSVELFSASQVNPRGDFVVSKHPMLNGSNASKRSPVKKPYKEVDGILEILDSDKEEPAKDLVEQRKKERAEEEEQLRKRNSGAGERAKRRHTDGGALVRDAEPEVRPLKPAKGRLPPLPQDNPYIESSPKKGEKQSKPTVPLPALKDNPYIPPSPTTKGARKDVTVPTKKEKPAKTKSRVDRPTPQPMPRMAATQQSHRTPSPRAAPARNAPASQPLPKRERAQGKKVERVSYGGFRTNPDGVINLVSDDDDDLVPEISLDGLRINPNGYIEVDSSDEDPLPPAPPARRTGPRSRPAPPPPTAEIIDLGSDSDEPEEPPASAVSAFPPAASFPQNDAEDVPFDMSSPPPPEVDQVPASLAPTPPSPAIEIEDGEMMDWSLSRQLTGSEPPLVNVSATVEEAPVPPVTPEADRLSDDGSEDDEEEEVRPIELQRELLPGIDDDFIDYVDDPGPPVEASTPLETRLREQEEEHELEIDPDLDNSEDPDLDNSEDPLLLTAQDDTVATPDDSDEDMADDEGETRVLQGPPKPPPGLQNLPRHSLKSGLSPEVVEFISNFVEWAVSFAPHRKIVHIGRDIEKLAPCLSIERPGTRVRRNIMTEELQAKISDANKRSESISGDVLKNALATYRLLLDNAIDEQAALAEANANATAPVLSSQVSNSTASSAATVQESQELPSQVETEPEMVWAPSPPAVFNEMPSPAPTPPQFTSPLPASVHRSPTIISATAASEVRASDVLNPPTPLGPAAIIKPPSSRKPLTNPFAAPTEFPPSPSRSKPPTDQHSLNTYFASSPKRLSNSPEVPLAHGKGKQTLAKSHHDDGLSSPEIPLRLAAVPSRLVAPIPVVQAVSSQPVASTFAGPLDSPALADLHNARVAEESGFPLETLEAVAEDLHSQAGPSSHRTVHIRPEASRAPHLGVDVEMPDSRAVSEQSSNADLTSALGAISLGRRTQSAPVDDDDDTPLPVVVRKKRLQPQVLQQATPPDSANDRTPDLPDQTNLRTATKLELLRAARKMRKPGERVDALICDMINSQHPYNLTDPFLRVVFESLAVQRTIQTEPRAPRITVTNTIDDEPCPPFEFHYFNRLVYGNNVRRGDPKKLKGCDCIGGCNSDAEARCACVRRQNKYWIAEGWNFRGFNYDADGRVRDHEFPIFECNEACGCDETCMNRVVQRGRTFGVEVKKTQHKGWGVFVKEDVPRGSFIGIYAGELITISESDYRGSIYDIFGRTYDFVTDFWYLKNVYRSKITGREHPGPEDAQKRKYSVDAFHVGNFTRFLNHSCAPNCRVVAVHIDESDIYKPFITLFTKDDVRAGEELTFSYAGQQDDDVEEQDGQKKTKSTKGRVKKNAGLKDKPCRCGAAKCKGRYF